MKKRSPTELVDVAAPAIRVRRDLGLTQHEAAARALVPFETWSSWERGRRKVQRGTWVMVLANIFENVVSPQREERIDP